MERKLFLWKLLLVALLALSVAFVGCEQAADDDDDDSASLVDLPDDFHGNWYLVAYQQAGGGPGMSGIDGSASGFLDNRLAFGSSWYTLEGVMGSHDGDAGYRDVNGDEFILFQAEGYAPLEVEVAYVDGETMQLLWPVVLDGEETTQLMVLAHTDSDNFYGIVVDQEQEPVAGADVTLYLDGSETGSGITGDIGLFVLPLSGAGTVRAEISAGDLGGSFETPAYGAPSSAMFTLTEADPTGNVAGLINDATTSMEPDVPVTVTLGGVDVTSSDGTYIFSDVPYGTYTITASATGYAAYSASVTVDAATVAHNIDLQPATGSGDIVTIEFGWGATSTADFDLNTNTPDGTRIYWANDGDLTAEPWIEHLTDYTDGPGPEIIEVAQWNTGSYQVYVDGSYDYTAEGGVLELKDGNGNVIGSFTPPSGENSYWYVCDIDGATQTVTTINRLQADRPGDEPANTQIAKWELFWGDNLDDLDLRVETPGGTVVGLGNSGSLTESPWIAFTNGDQTDGPGPERTEVAQLESGTYKVYGKSYASGDDWTASGAYLVTTFTDNTTNTQYPPSGTGDFWHIANVDGATHAITWVNTLVDIQPIKDPSVVNERKE